MDNSKKIEQLRFVINRFDHFTEGANSKGNFLLAFCGLIFGFIASNFKDIIALNENSYQTGTSFLLVSLLILSLISIFLIILAVSPFLKNTNSSSKNYHSLIFFNSIAETTEKEFICKVKNQKEKELIHDLSKQAHIISKGLQTKHSRIGWSLKSLIFQLFLILIIIIIKSI